MPDVLPFPSPAPSREWFTLRAAADGRRATLDIRGQIGVPEVANDFGIEAAGTFAEFERAVKALGDGVREIELNVYSPGGDVFTALAMHDLLVRHPARIVGRVDGIAASAATVVLMAADEVEIPENAYFMIHNPLVGVYGDYRAIETMLGRMKKWTRDLANVYTARLEDAGKGDRAELLDRVLQMMDEETYLTGAEALELGFADRTAARIDLAACALPQPLALRVHHPDRIPGELRALVGIDSPPAESAAPAAPDTPTIATTPTAMANDLSPESPCENPSVPAIPAQEPQPEAPVAPAAANAEAPAATAEPAAEPAPAEAPEAIDGQKAAPAANAEPVDLGAQLGALLDQRLAPLTEKLTAQQTEIDRLSALRANGVDPAAWGNAPAVGTPLREEPGEPEAIDFAGARPESLISAGLKRLREKRQHQS